MNRYYLRNGNLVLLHTYKHVIYSSNPADVSPVNYIEDLVRPVHNFIFDFHIHCHWLIVIKTKILLDLVPIKKSFNYYASNFWFLFNHNHHHGTGAPASKQTALKNIFVRRPLLLSTLCTSSFHRGPLALIQTIATSQSLTCIGCSTNNKEKEPGLITNCRLVLRMQQCFYSH